MTPPLAGRIAGALAEARAVHVTHAVVYDEVHSTQDAARELASGARGIMVLARRQTRGRGRLGRSWADPSGKGVAATFVLDSGSWPPEHLSIAAGIAAHGACARALGRAGPDSGLGLRWPNDVVESGGARRKLAGVLIERQGSCTLVGVGINVRQAPADWPPELAPRACSLAELDPSTGDVDGVSIHLALAMERALSRPLAALCEDWRRLDTLVGTRQTFEHDARRTAGTVRSIDPTGHIELLDDSGEIIRLPALTTSLVHPD